ncbi:MAG: site-2 protease family protein [Candidatus Jacksonbacteria bacterium]
MIIKILVYFLVIIPSVIIHEVAHGVVALWLGDDTAKRAGRLTLNPISHIDFFGTIILPLSMIFLSTGMMFGYAKPVPYNPYNLKSEKDELKIALAGPLSNFIFACVFSIFGRIIFNVYSLEKAAILFGLVALINIGLAIFNLIPIPPLDGSKLLYLIIPKENVQLRAFLDRYGLFLLLFFIFFGIRFISPVYILLSRLFLGSNLLGATLQFLYNLF